MAASATRHCAKFDIGERSGSLMDQLEPADRMLTCALFDWWALVFDGRAQKGWCDLPLSQPTPSAMSAVL